MAQPGVVRVSAARPTARPFTARTLVAQQRVMIPDPHVSSGAWSGIAGDDHRGPLRVGLVFR